MKAYVNKSPTIKAQVQWLAQQTKSMPYLIKEEAEGKLIKV